MTIVGEIKNGVAVFESALPWPDGTQVVVEAKFAQSDASGLREQAHDQDIEKGKPSVDGDLNETAAPRTLLEQFGSIIGIGDGLPSDMAENHDHYIHGTPKK